LRPDVEPTFRSASTAGHRSREGPLTGLAVTGWPKGQRYKI